jgi:hypothetical protein
MLHKSVQLNLPHNNECGFMCRVERGELNIKFNYIIQHYWASWESISSPHADTSIRAVANWFYNYWLVNCKIDGRGWYSVRQTQIYCHSRDFQYTISDVHTCINYLHVKVHFSIDVVVDCAKLPLIIIVISSESFYPCCSF